MSQAELTTLRGTYFPSCGVLLSKRRIHRTGPYSRRYYCGTKVRIQDSDTFLSRVGFDSISVVALPSFLSSTIFVSTALLPRCLLVPMGHLYRLRSCLTARVHYLLLLEGRFDFVLVLELRENRECCLRKRSNLSRVFSDELESGRFERLTRT